MPADVAARWGACIQAEWTLQVTAERELGLPVSVFMDVQDSTLDTYPATEPNLISMFIYPARSHFSTHRFVSDVTVKTYFGAFKKHCF